jgi:magnesium transporter
VSRFLKRVSKKAGLPPGTLIHIGEKKTDKVKITVMDYDESNLDIREIENIEECFPFKETPTVTWINIDGLHQVDIIEQIGNHFELHPLILEDIVNTSHRPKMEDHDRYIFIVLKMLYFNKDQDRIESEQISMIMGSNYVISFQEKEGDVFHTIRERIRSQRGRIRKMGTDYLIYRIMDAIVDSYFIIMEKSGEQLEILEDQLSDNPDADTMKSIHKLKNEMMILRKSVWPVREVLSGIERGEIEFISDKTTNYFRDVYDHTIQVIDTIETFRDMLSGMLDMYLSIVSNKMNEIMKILTIIATIFIPLTFIAGIYGMNFKYMPELEFYYGYFVVWGVMIVVTLIMIVFFKRKKWL